MTISKTVVFGLLALGLALAEPHRVSGQDSTVDRPSDALARLHQADLDGRTIALDGTTLERDAFRFTLRGTAHLLEPVDGSVPGVVFLGDGRMSMMPRTPVERRHLSIRTGSTDPLEDRFERAVFLFGDDAVQALSPAAPSASSGNEPAARKAGRELLAHAAEEGMDVALRWLRGHANDDNASQTFFAVLDGVHRGRAIAAIDMAGILDGEEVCLRVTEGDDPGYWYSNSIDEWARVVSPIDTLHYAIESTVAKGTDIEATAEVRFKVLAPSLRAVSFDLLPSLEIREARIIDANAPTAIDVVHGVGGSVAFLPEAVEAGATVSLRIAYGGSGVLVDEGTDIYAVEARTNWYPNFGVLKDRARYDLRFSVPDDLSVVAVGREVSSTKAEGRLLSHWTTDRPITVAGFNYGAFERFEQIEENTGTELTVYASKGEPDIITEINRDLAAASGSAGTDPRLLSGIANGGGGTFVDLRGGTSSLGISTTATNELALADAINSVQVLSAYFGPVSDKRLAMTQQSNWNFGQAWPSLVYLPYLMAISKMIQADVGLEGYAGFYDQVGIHEIAHQWWGHEVGWASYRDQWLSEGFAEFSTALVVELTQGANWHRAFWSRRRSAVLGRPTRGDLPAYQAGSLDLGFRASTKATPFAYSALAYSKGAFVLHMLRMLMRDFQNEQPDARFFAMMKDFVDTHRGTNASTEDFKRIVEKHIVPELNATRDGTVDWFFDQWVYGTEIPVIKGEFAVEKAGKGKFRITGTVSQARVPDGFLTLTGLYVEDNKGVLRQFGRMPFRGPSSRQVDVTLDLPKKPKAVLVNAEYEVLAFDG